ncbi:filamentous hemagglutinin N-terminal domain-containing protein, partial [Iningainema tapete]
MSGISTRWFLGIAMYAFSANCANAQITPDGTLPNNSIVTPDGSTLNITGGTQAGGNLFHSFSEFSVPTGGTAIFNNAADIQNIISRVTGGSVSNIDGIIKASGTANLFLINPSGIIFGQNASLNIGGSFVASTASSLNFADGTIFSATTPQTTPLLTISVPIGLQFGAIPKEIQLKDANLLNDPLGITRALIGGNVVLDKSGLRARGGRVELGGLAQAGTVNLAMNNNDISLNFPPNTARADVSLINGSVVNVRSVGGGSIVINANNLKMSEGSQLRAGISGTGTASSQAGDIKIDTTGTITLDGAYSFISNAVLERSVGNGGNVDIKAGALSVTNGGQIYAGTYGRGDAGNVSINVRDRASFDGVG